MTFQSFEYLIFISIVFIIYWTICRNNKILQNSLIVVASLIFYGWWDWRFLGLLILTTLSTFYGATWMNLTENQKKRRMISDSTIILNIGILFFFKYYNFFLQAFIDTLSSCGLNLSISTLKIILPVGISFYIFSALSYSIDVYQRKISPTHDLLAYSAYVMFFPSILSGPISRAQKQLPQYFKVRTFNYDKIVNGCKLLLMGGG